MSAKPTIAPVIMCGGAGSRLWPASTQEWPKPFRAFGAGPTLFQDTVLRVTGPDFAPPIVICGAAHRTLAEAQLGQIGVAPGAIVLEPSPRGTAALTVVASRLVAKRHPHAHALLLPADHAIDNVAEFHRAIGLGAAAADQAIVTFGIKPDRPETGYGYIESGEVLTPGVARVVRFVEKPDAVTAQAYLDAGTYAWNAGIFLFSPQLMLDECRRLVPGIAALAASALEQAVRHGALVELDEGAFIGCPEASIDRAVMEKTQAAAVVACDIGWTDVGSWSEIWRLGPLDQAGVRAHGPVTLLDVADTLVWSDGPPVAVLGVSDLVVVAAGGAVLVAPRARAQAVRDLVDALKAGKAPAP